MTPPGGGVTEGRWYSVTSFVYISEKITIHSNGYLFGNFGKGRDVGRDIKVGIRSDCLIVFQTKMFLSNSLILSTL